VENTEVRIEGSESDKMELTLTKRGPRPVGTDITIRVSERMNSVAPASAKPVKTTVRGSFFTWAKSQLDRTHVTNELRGIFTPPIYLKIIPFKLSLLATEERETDGPLEV